ncbi:PAAR domain-containing protein [Psychrobacter phenylpyruvicus]|uniref:Uncharacterized conserved protein n=1 Tax=Psychrobacter phenylpyruvicus TaxID=29432 RepID=A0A379LI83_9GAMM|nr:PAAR domain-containing protein [Psychrobacter phenylpyruvicus]SUD89795.1 Uncharacterized conserved protein [Psychrobacter phenylpyruvicus]
MAAYITVGAKTTHGGTVVSGSPHTTHNGIPVARKGDKVICKKCKKIVTIATGDPSFIIDGAPIARAGDVTTCGSKLIAIQQSFAQSDFEVGEIEPIKQPEPLQFNRSDSNHLMEEEVYDDKFQLLDELTQEPLVNVSYQLKYDGKVVSGNTDSQGFTQLIEADNPAEVSISLLVDEEE